MRFVAIKLQPIPSSESPAILIPEPVRSMEENEPSPISFRPFWNKWFAAFKHVIPIYFTVHLAFLITTCLSVLFRMGDFVDQSFPLYTLWQTWHHWDTQQYIDIATWGYTDPWRTAFFPLFPLLERGLTYVVHNPFIAGLLISNMAGLVMLMVLYQLVCEDFDHERAVRAVLYLSLFPTAFFFAAAYNETLFLSLALLSFYQMRRGQWWLGAIFGFFASLTRSAGLFLLLPFCYEYLRQHQFRLKAIRFNSVGGVLIPAGVVVFALYCYKRFGDLLAFSHAESHWGHELHMPFYGIFVSIQSIMHSHGVLGYQVLHNLLDLVPDLFVLVLLLLCVVGPWRFPRTHWSYCIYAVTLYLFLQLFPIASVYPLQSMGRYMLEIFPAFIVLAVLGKNQTVNLNYLMLAGTLLFFLLTQFLLKHWII